MKPRWSLDLLRGVLLAVTLKNFLDGFEIARVGISYPDTLAIGIGLLIPFAWASWALLFPSHGRLQGVFVLFTVAAIMPPLLVFWISRVRSDASMVIPVHHFRPISFIGVTTSIALAIAAWFLYRSEPKKT